MTSPFAQVAQNVVNLLPAIAVLVVVVSVAVTFVSMTQTKRSKKPVTEQAHRKLHDSQITVIEEPDETRGLALRELDVGVELLRIEEKDGDYYRSAKFAVYDNEDIGQVADYLSEYVCEQEREVTE